MKYAFYLVAVFFVLSCNQAVDEQEELPVIQPSIQLSPFDSTVKAALTEILKKKLDPSGENASVIEITGMEIIKISRKYYLTYERSSQIEGFDKYLKYIDKFKNTSNPIYKPAEIEDNKRKHAAVVAYLNEVIKKASEEKDLFKVAYYVKADAKNIKFTQLQTTYLDADFKEIVSDYGHLKKQ